jgi:hypothetical protein
MTVQGTAQHIEDEPIWTIYFIFNLYSLHAAFFFMAALFVHHPLHKGNTGTQAHHAAAV